VWPAAGAGFRLADRIEARMIEPDIICAIEVEIAERRQLLDAADVAVFRATAPG